VAAGRVDEVTLNVFPDEQGISSPANYAAVHNDSLEQCRELQDRFAIMSLYTVSENNQGSESEPGRDAAAFRNLGIGTDDERTRYGAAYYPNIETIFDYAYDPADVTIVHRVGSADGDYNGGALDALRAGNNAFFKRAEGAILSIPCRIPPSAIMAGIYAGVDGTRGVWKAPANVGLASIVRPTVTISNAQQEGLNIEVNGRSINAIRTFVGRGTRVWGARTLNGNDNEWRYVNVRRFFNFAEESIKKATNQFVFEPNDANTWTRVRAMIENFLTLQWRAGALQGSTPEQAFYVNVGLNVTMTSLDILEGRMIVEIGMAVVRPAEFIILQFMHKMAEA
jgi:phage tail sheath protein FI